MKTSTHPSSTTIYDVAREAQVSPKSVSRVINGERGVSDGTRERIQRVIAQMNYRPSLLARGLSGAHAYTVGLVYDNPNAYYIIAMQQGALRACHNANFGLEMYPCNSSAKTLAEELRDFAQRSRIAGLVLTTPVSERSGCLRQLEGYGIPFIRVISAVKSPRGGSNCVYVDDRDAARAVTAYLLQLGHTRIAFLKGGKRHHASAERLAGYESALQAYGVTIDRKLVIDSDYMFDEGFRGARKVLGLANPPTAIFGCNDEIAAGALAAAHAMGLHVPYDVSIAGFEDSAFSQRSWPAITTARQRADVIVEHAVHMLIAQMGGATVANERFTPELIVRGSTAPPRPMPERRKRERYA